MHPLTKREITSLKEVFENEYERIRFGFFEDIESPHTKRAYLNDLYQFGIFLKAHFEDVRIINARREHIVAFKRFLITHGGKKGVGLSDKSVNRKLSCISKFYTYLGEQGLVQANPVQFVKRARVDFKVESDFFETSEVRAILESTSAETLTKALHQAILFTFFTTGMRIGELISLKRGNFVLLKGDFYFEYKAKGNRRVVKRVTKKTQEAISEYLSLREIEGIESEGLFIPSRNQVGEKDKALNPSSVRKIIKTYAKKAGIERRTYPHMARATVIGELLENGWDIYKSCEFIGHKDIKMTIAYDKKRASLNNNPEGVLGY